jgi:hypothetical protein
MFTIANIGRIITFRFGEDILKAELILSGRNSPAGK